MIIDSDLVREALSNGAVPVERQKTMFPELFVERPPRELTIDDERIASIASRLRATCAARRRAESY